MAQADHQVAFAPIHFHLKFGYKRQNCSKHACRIRDSLRMRLAPSIKTAQISRAKTVPLGAMSYVQNLAHHCKHTQ